MFGFIHVVLYTMVVWRTVIAGYPEIIVAQRMDVPTREIHRPHDAEAGRRRPDRSAPADRRSGDPGPGRLGEKKVTEPRIVALVYPVQGSQGGGGERVRHERDIGGQAADRPARAPESIAGGTDRV